MKTSGYNIMRDDSALLEEHERSPPSFAVHLYPDHWTLNNGPKFAYNNQVSSLLDDIRAFRIPTDFIAIFDDAGIPYYNGCMIVELLDFRPARAREPLLDRPDKQRVVLRPNAETIWTDICTMNAKTGSTWSDMDALRLEEKLLLSTSTPLCLDPDPSLTRIVNSMIRVSTPNIPNSLKRKAAAMVDLEEDETEKAKRAKIMQFMNPQFNTARKPFHPNYKILAILEQKRAAEAAAAQAAQPSSGAVAPVSLPPNTMAPSSTNIPQASDKAPSTIIPMLTTSYSQSNMLPQPVPVAAPPTQIPAHLQQVAAPSQRLSPLKQQQNAPDSSPQRPPSQPGGAPQANGTNQQQQTQGQQQPQSAAFNPPIPPSNFLNPPPQSRRRSSTAIKPGTTTPAAPNAPLPTQQPTNVAQPQAQQQPQSQPQPQTTFHQQSTLQPHQGQSQAPPPTPQMHPSQQLPTNMQSIQNMAFFQQNGRAPLNPATIARGQALSGRSTPVNAIRQSTSSPAPSTSAMARSPMIPQANATAMMSGRNTPVSTNNQVARGSPLASNPVAAARISTVQNGVQQQPQPPIPGAQPIAMQPGATQNANPYYHQFQMSQHHHYAFMRARMQQQQQQQQGHTATAPQHQQHNQQTGNPQVQQTGQEQTAGVQTFPSVQIPPQMYNYMPMNMSAQQQQQQQQFLWRQGMIGRGMPQIPPNGQQQMPMPPGMTIQQMQGLGRGGGLPNR